MPPVLHSYQPKCHVTDSLYRELQGVKGREGGTTKVAQSLFIFLNFISIRTTAIIISTMRMYEE